MKLGPIRVFLAAIVALIVGLALVFLKCRSPQQRSAISYIDICTPGESFETCRKALWPSPATSTALPAGDLIAIRVDIASRVADPPPDQPLHVVVRYGFDYSMQFAKDSDFDAIIGLIQRELGTAAHGSPTVFGVPAKADAANPSDVYWVTADGEWACSRSGVVHWYSSPLEGYRPGEASAEQLDRFVKPAPNAAALWRKLGRALVDR